MLRLFVIFPIMKIFLVVNLQLPVTSFFKVLSHHHNIIAIFYRFLGNTLFLFVCWCRTDLFIRPFLFSSSKNLWTAPPRIRICYIFYCHYPDCFICRVEFGCGISPLRKFSIYLNFSN